MIALDPTFELERDLEEETAMDRQEERESREPTEPVRCPRCGIDLSQVGIEDAAVHVSGCAEAEADRDLLERLDRRATAAAVVTRVREAAHARRGHTASETVAGIRVALLATGAWSVTGHDRRIRICTDQIAAIHAVVALLSGGEP